MQNCLPAKIETRLRLKIARMANFAAHQVVLDATGVLFFIRNNVLVVSDLHLEKGSYLQSFASPIPNYDTIDTLIRLERMVDHYEPRTVICLGDSFHDLKALRRIEASAYQKLELLIDKVDKWVWVLGNHDAVLPDDLKGLQTNSYQIDNLLLVHEPEELTNSSTVQVIGHYHPKMTFKAAGQSISGKCFVFNSILLVMPSFGSYTGGLDIQNSVLSDLLGALNINRYFIAQDKIWPL